MKSQVKEKMKKNIIPTIEKALDSLGIVQWRITGASPTTEVEFNSRFEKIMNVKDGECTFSSDPSDFGVTWSQVKTELDSMQATHDAQEYARNRQAAYPDMGSQLNKIYDDGVTKWKSEMVDPVKAKWPKDNSGPV